MLAWVCLRRAGLRVALRAGLAARGPASSSCRPRPSAASETRLARRRARRDRSCWQRRAARSPGAHARVDPHALTAARRGAVGPVAPSTTPRWLRHQHRSRRHGARRSACSPARCCCSGRAVRSAKPAAPADRSGDRRHRPRRIGRRHRAARRRAATCSTGSGGRIDAGARPFGPFVNRNHFATWVVMACPLVFGLSARAGAARAPAASALRSAGRRAEAARDRCASGSRRRCAS